MWEWVWDGIRSGAAWVWDSIRSGSAYTIVGVLFALPGFIGLAVIEPAITGYYLIAAVSMIGHRALRSIGEHAEETDEDPSDQTQYRTVVFALLVVSATVVGIGVRLALAAVIAGVVVSTTGGVLAGVVAAVAVPVVDFHLAASGWRRSPSAIVTMLYMHLVGQILQITNLVDGISGQSLFNDTRRFGPI